MELMRSLKKLIDPNNILNPGKMGLDDEVSREQGAKSKTNRIRRRRAQGARRTA
jgi:hypothetical protein